VGSNHVRVLRYRQTWQCVVIMLVLLSVGCVAGQVLRVCVIIDVQHSGDSLL
jgi:hypothetical protein